MSNTINATAEADVLLRVIQRLNGNPYSLTKSECISEVEAMRNAALAAAEAAQAQPEFEGEVIIGHSVERGGWCVYEQTGPAEYEALKGPFATREQAEAAMREPAPAAQAQPASVPKGPAAMPAAYEAVEAQIVGRYQVQPRNGGGFWPYCVKAGDGSMEIFKGHKTKCEEVAAALRTACLDGAYMASAAQPVAAVPAPAVPIDRTKWTISPLDPRPACCDKGKAYGCCDGTVCCHDEDEAKAAIAWAAYDAAMLAAAAPAQGEQQ